MDGYKNITIRYINGYRVTSKTLLLSPEEEEKRLSEVREAIEKIIISNKVRERTA
jgi:hypothetical protein